MRILGYIYAWTKGHILKCVLKLKILILLFSQALNYLSNYMQKKLVIILTCKLLKQYDKIIQFMLYNHMYHYKFGRFINQINCECECLQLQCLYLLLHSFFYT